MDSATKSLAITGGTILGFSEGQQKDVNTSRTELGLGSATVETGNVIGFRDGMLASPSFRAHTIQDLVHVLNGMIQQQFAGQPFTATLGYSNTPVRTVTFNIALGSSYTKSVDLDFGTGIDVGFANLSIAGGANATFTANAGVELRVGIDLDPVGSGTISSATLLSSLDKGRGAQVKVGVLGSVVSNMSAGKPTPLADAVLALTINRFGNQTSNVTVSVPSTTIANNTSLTDLAIQLSAALKATSIAGLPLENDTAPVEVQVSDGRLYVVANSNKINGITVASGTSIS